MSNKIGIDISGVQGDDVPGDWEFIVVKLSEGGSMPNTRFAAQWANARRTRRGVYHYARPNNDAPLASGAVQARYFSDRALENGFRPGVDMWQLDCEGALNSGVSGSAWRSFIDVFMDVGLAWLGPLGFLYAGKYFFANEIQPARFNWWLPDYGDNQGGLHPLVGVNPVIHQFTSHGGLDQNVIHDVARWNALTQQQASPAPQPKKKGKKLLYMFVCRNHIYGPARLATFITDGITYRALGSQQDVNTQLFLANSQGAGLDAAKLPDLDYASVVAHMVEVKAA